MGERTFGQRIADTVARYGGSWYFIFSGFGCLMSWVLLNSLDLFKSIRWDEPPYILLNLFLSIIAAFQGPFIMMSQRRAAEKQDEDYRNLFNEIKESVQLGIDIENKLVNMVDRLTEQVESNIKKKYNLHNR